MQIKVKILGLLIFNSFFNSSLVLGNQALNDSIKMVTYFDSAVFTRNSDYKKAIRFLDTVNMLAGQEKLQFYKPKIYNLFAIIYNYSNHYDSAFIYYNEALKWALQLNDEVYINKIYSNLADLFSLEGEYEKALEYNLKVLKYNESKKDSIEIARTCYNRGKIYYLFSKRVLARDYFKKSMNILKNRNDEVQLAINYNSLGIIEQDAKNYDKAIEYYKKSLDIKHKFNDKIGAINTLSNIAAVETERKNYQKAINVSNEALDIAQSIDNINETMLILENLGTDYLKIQQYKKALDYHFRAYQMAQKLNDAETTRNALEGIYKCYESLGNYPEAYNYLSKYVSVKDSTMNLKVQSKIEEAEVRYQTEKKEKDLLKEQHKNTIFQLAISSRNKWIFALSSGILALLFLGISIYEGLKRKHQKDRDKLVLEERDRGLKAIIDAQEEERTKIAKELHDGVGNQLLALKMNWQRFCSKIQNDEVDTAKVDKILTEVVDEVRNVSHQMMPKVLNEFGVVPAIREMLEKTLPNTNIKHHFETHNASHRFNHRIEIALYRITQELINNVIKHSKATLVNVQLLNSQKYLILIIEDNGKGMVNKNKTSDGIGFSSIKSRLNTINGELNILPGDSTGTLVTVRIPIE